jgi:hypothetical protein
MVIAELPEEGSCDVDIEPRVLSPGLFFRIHRRGDGNAGHSEMAFRIEAWCPNRVLHDRVDLAASPAMSVTPPKAEVDSEHKRHFHDHRELMAAC